MFVCTTCVHVRLEYLVGMACFVLMTFKFFLSLFLNTSGKKLRPAMLDAANECLARIVVALGKHAEAPLVKLLQSLRAHSDGRPDARIGMKHA